MYTHINIYIFFLYRYIWGLGFRGLGFRGLGFRGLGVYIREYTGTMEKNVQTTI